MTFRKSINFDSIVQFVTQTAQKAEDTDSHFSRKEKKISLPASSDKVKCSQNPWQVHRLNSREQKNTGWCIKLANLYFFFLTTGMYDST